MGFATALPYWKIFPYVLYIILYFYIADSKNQAYPDENFKTVAFKALPLASLLFMILSAEDKSNQHGAYKKMTCIGLLFSMAGDACLVWRIKLFIPGLIFFAAAHVFYTLAYGIKPFGGYPTMFSCIIIGGVIYAYLLPAIKESVMQVMVLLYTGLIFAMGWRAIARLQHRQNIGTVCAFLGALLFVISDFMIAVDKWKFRIKDASYWIMVTYFSAQLLISLSATAYTRTDAEYLESSARKKKKN